MKRNGVILLLLMMMYNAANAQFYIGLRDNRYALAGYKWHSGWNVQLDHSIFDESFKYQYIRCSGGFQFEKNKYFKLAASPFVGTTYCANFYDLGINLSGSVAPVKWLGIDAEINPRYDSDYGYKTCYMLGTAFNVNKELTILAQYNAIPEYRISEKRVKIGLRLTVKNLQVSPMVSLPVEGNTKALRILVGLRYEFSERKKLNSKTDEYSIR